MNTVSVSMVVDKRAEWNPVFASLCAAEIIIGLLGIFASDFLPVFGPLAAFAGLAGVAALGYCVIRPDCVKVYDLFSATLLLAYGTGTLNSLVSLALSHQVLLANTIPSEYWYTRTLALVLCACGCLHLVGRIDTNGYLLGPTPSTQREARRILVLVIPFFLVYGFLLKTGKIGFMGNTSAEGGPEVSPVATLMMSLAVPIGALALSVALRITRSKTSIVLFLFSGLILLVQFGLGRRVFLFSLLTYIVCTLFVRRPLKLVSMKNAGLLLIAVVLLYVATTAFYALRMASWTMNARGAHAVSVVELIPKAYEIYTQDRVGRLQAGVAKNIQLRTFVLQYLTDISRGEAIREPLYGADLYRAIIVATPSVLYPGKLRDPLFSAEEPLINPAFGIAVFDGPNSILTAGVADFGAFGLFLYPLVYCGVLSLLLRAIYKFGPPAAGLFFGMYVCGLLFTVESDIAAYLGSLRQVIPATLVLWLYFRASGSAQPPVGR